MSGTTSSVLERVSEDDVRGLQAYTIRKMDQYMSTGKDTDHYKLLSVSKKPLDNCQKYLVFPVLISYRVIWRVSSSSSQIDF